MNKLFLFICTVVLLAACSKNSQLISDPDRSLIGTGAYLKFVKNNNLLIDYNTLSASTVSVTVKEIGEAVDKINIYTGSSADPGTWKLATTVPGTGTSAENTILVKATDITKALNIQPADLTPGTSVTLYTEVVTKTGKKYNIANANPDLQGQPAYAAEYFFKAVVFCNYDAATTNNKVYTVVQDDWADFAAGDIITVVNGPAAGQVTLQGVWATAFNHKDLVLTVAANGSAVVAKQQYGAYTNGGAIWSAEGNGFVFSCINTIDITLTHSSTDGTATGARFILKKQ
ncbi:MAG: hypothetical protein ABIR15_01225 [Chitinophagaceae bacterium]